MTISSISIVKLLISISLCLRVSMNKSKYSKINSEEYCFSWINADLMLLILPIFIDNLDSSGGSSSGMALEIVEIRNGEKIIAGSGSELILRGGEAVIIGSEMGGISDVTLGKDFVSGMSVVPNHLMIVPRDDGRGVYAEKYAIFMVRGSYKVVK